MILEVDREKERVSLGLKQMTDNPWADIERKYRSIPMSRAA